MEAYGNVRMLLPRLAGEEPAGEMLVALRLPDWAGSSRRTRARAREGLWDAPALEKSLDNCCPVDATGRLVARSAAARPAGTKAAPRPKSTDQGLSDDALHEEYAWAFVLHNLVPFADKLLGIAGAMDQRPSPSMIGRCACPSSSGRPRDRLHKWR